MAQLDVLKTVLGTPSVTDALLTFYLDNAGNIIKELRDSNIVESKYETTQIKIAVELFNKRGAEGQSGHSENGINRSYESADVSPSLLSQITPFVRTPFGGTRVVV